MRISHKPSNTLDRSESKNSLLMLGRDIIWVYKSWVLALWSTYIMLVYLLHSILIVFLTEDKILVKKAVCNYRSLKCLKYVQVIRKLWMGGFANMTLKQFPSREGSWQNHQLPALSPLLLLLGSFKIFWSSSFPLSISLKPSTWEK